MDQSELGFNTWVLIGNTLNALLRGSMQAALAGNEALQAKLQSLDEALANISPERMLQALATLPSEDRTLLLNITAEAMQQASDKAQQKLGLDTTTATEVLHALRTEAA